MGAQKNSRVFKNNPECNTSDFKLHCTTKQQKQHTEHKTDMWLSEKKHKTDK